MSTLSNILHRSYLRFALGSGHWHRRCYRPEVNVVESENRIWFEEGNAVLEAYPARLLKGAFSGRCNLLLSGPSVKQIRNSDQLSCPQWIGVNGSPALFGENIPQMALYHVNDRQFIRSNLKRFLKYSASADYTLIDYRGAYELLRLAPNRLEKQIKLVIFDCWAWPHRLPIGMIEKLARPPQRGDVFLSTDLTLGLAQGGTVAYTAAQAAWLGGYQSLYIYGLDLTNSGRFYKEDCPQPQMLDKAYERAIQPAFELLVKESMKDGFNLVNCNPQSRLPASIIPKIDPDESFKHD